MNFRFHHVGLVAEDLEQAQRCERFYREMFGMQVVYQEILNDIGKAVYLTDRENPEGMGLKIVALDRTLGSNGSQTASLISGHGPQLNHVGFQVKNVEEAVEHLVSEGIQPRGQTVDLKESRIAPFEDPAGVPVLLHEFKTAPDLIAFEETPFAFRAQFNHTGILTGERRIIASCEDFYRRTFKMRVVRKGDPDDPTMDWVYLGNEEGDNPFWLEIAGEAYFDHERQFLDQYGPSLDHLCFETDDTNQCIEWLTARGAQIVMRPTDYYLTRLAYVRDPAGVVIQIRQGFRDEVLT